MKFILYFIFVGLISSVVSKTFFSENCNFRNESKSCTKQFGEWMKLRRSDLLEEHTVIIAVRKPSSSAATCESELTQVSDPDSPRYGQYYSLSGLSKLDLFDSVATEHVEKWLLDNQLRYKKTFHGDWISVTASVKQFEKILNAEFYTFQSNITKKFIKRTASYSIPSLVTDYIEFIENTIVFPSPTKVSSFYSKSEVGSESGYVTPSLINSVYGIVSNQITNQLATQSVFESLGQSYSPEDLTQFQETYNVTINPIYNVIGPNTPSQCTPGANACDEASLDVQYIMAVAQGSPTTFWSISESESNIFLSWIIAVSDDSNPPLVHSISYTDLENPYLDLFRFSTDVCQLGLRGLTVFSASGDDGVAGYVARSDAAECALNSYFPASCPYVTAVGATQGPELGEKEIACSSSTNGLITTGGGFSFYYPMPAYQESAVNNYLLNGPNIPPSSLFNSSNRAFPDIALMGHNYQIIEGGSLLTISGTSASTPVFAAIITLINNARLNAGLPSVGFLNPTLYKLAEGSEASSIFNDITSGENNCCAGSPGSQVCCTYGFTASSGWDPLTGLGSVNVQPLMKALLVRNSSTSMQSSLILFLLSFVLTLMY